MKDPQKTLEAILNAKITLFPGHIQSVFYQSILKILTFIIQSSDNDEIIARALISMTIDRMTVFLSSGDVEAQERVCFDRFYFMKNKILCLGKCYFEYPENCFKINRKIGI